MSKKVVTKKKARCSARSFDTALHCFDCEGTASTSGRSRERGYACCCVDPNMTPAPSAIVYCLVAVAGFSVSLTCILAGTNFVVLSRHRRTFALPNSCSSLIFS